MFKTSLPGRSLFSCCVLLKHLFSGVWVAVKKSRFIFLDLILKASRRRGVVVAAYYKIKSFTFLFLFFLSFLFQ